MVILEFAGEFDVAQADRLSDALAVAAGADDVILDFCNVSYMDSTMLTALIAFRRLRSRRGHHGRVTIEGAGEMARRLFAITHLDKFFDLREPSASRSRQATRILVLGRDLPKSRTAEDFAYTLDRMLCTHPDIHSKRDSDDVLRWICGGRQCQAHCVSDTEVVLMHLHEQATDPVSYWTVDDVRKVTVDQTSPWTAAEDLVDFLAGPRAAVLQKTL
jgi:anti-anti-sigma factor